MLMPRCLLERIQSCRVLHISGDRLQLIAKPGREDHRPLQVTLRYQLVYTAPSLSTAWDYTALAATQAGDELHTKFLQNVASLAEQ